MEYGHTLGGIRHRFASLSALMACATPFRSGDALAGIAAQSAEERVAAQYALAELPLRQFLSDLLIPYETDEVTRLIIDTHNAAAFAPVASLTVGEFRDWLLSDSATGERLAAISPGITPEMAVRLEKAIGSTADTCCACRSTMTLRASTVRRSRFEALFRRERFA